MSEAKRFATDNLWEVANLAMQVMGGIGYTDIYPIERSVRDARLPQIWTGTNQVMDLLIQHEYYNEVLSNTGKYRDVEADAMCAEEDQEKIFDDEEMWQVFNERR